MAKSNTNRPLTAVVDHAVDRALLGSMKEIRANARQQNLRIQNAVAQFFDMFAAMAINTPAAPALDVYTPIYAPLSSRYARTKPANAGYFYKTGQLQDDIRNLTSQTTNLLGKSSYYLEQTSRGAKKGFTETSALTPRNIKTGRFVSRAEGLKHFKVKVVHTPFSKVERGFRPRTLEREIFEGAYEDIYVKLTNQQSRGRNRPYRPAFYSFMKWWLNRHLPEVIR